jgi:hypothetical protein
MSTYEFTIGLQIRHPTINPHTITQQLGIAPQHAWQAGSPRRSPAGEGLDGVYRESYWTAKLMDEPPISSERITVESALTQTASLLRRSNVFLEQLNADGGVAELHVNLFARGDFRLDLLAESLALLGRLRLTIALDVHLHTASHASLSAAN